MEMIFKTLYIFSPREKLARKIAFARGINIITSSKIDGAKRGKSVVARSLFHALGAESLLEGNFDVKSKVFILHFEVDSTGYYIFRAADLFKVFNENMQLIFTSTRARDLSEKLMGITRFCVELPSRDKDKLEIAPSVYNYLPFYVDQDRYHGSKFESFKNLGQYENFKESVLLCHFGVFTREYFDLVREKELVESKKLEQENRIKVLAAILKDIKEKLEGKEYSKDLDALRRDVKQYQKKYSEAVRRLNESRNRLVAFRNALYDFEKTIAGIVAFQRRNESAIKSLHNHQCPECGSLLELPISLKSRRYNLADDILGVKTDIQESMIDLKAKIEEEERHYKGLLDVLHNYELSMKINTTEIDDILRFKGFCEVREDIADEYQTVQVELENNINLLSGLLKKIREFNKRKKKINDRYYEMLIRAKTRFGLEEIDSEKFKSISKIFDASGSDRCIATIIWHFAIIMLRNEFNPEAIRFPIVFDSPNNVETDDEKTDLLLRYLLENSELSSQFIVSGIGLDTDEFKSMTDKPMNIVTLSNEQYHLLGKDDYQQYVGLLEAFCDAGLVPNGTET